jgi:deazaflavin-dependent oxidoreductase (nitroreductase family)
MEGSPGMTAQGEYAPSAFRWVRDQVETFERSGGKEANSLLDTGLPVIVVTMRGNKTGKIRKIALMRVEHEGEYALVASLGGAPKHPVWYYNIKAKPNEVAIQDGDRLFDVRVHEASGKERDDWWRRAVAAYPPYQEYQQKTSRQIPVFVARPVNLAPSAS